MAEKMEEKSPGDNAPDGAVEKIVELPAMELVWDPSSEGDVDVRKNLLDLAKSFGLEKGGTKTFRVELSRVQDDALDLRGVQYFEVRLSEKKKGLLDFEGPSFLAELISHALAYESKQENSIDVTTAELEIRVQTPEVSKEFIEMAEGAVQKPHFDGVGVFPSSYIITSAIPTVQVTGTIAEKTKAQIVMTESELAASRKRDIPQTENLLEDPRFADTYASSALPLKLYYLTEDMLHAQPFLESWKEHFADPDADPRIFVRITFKE